MKAKGERYLIYESESWESDVIYFVCDDEQTAKAVVETIVKFMERLARRLPSYPAADVPDEDAALWMAVEEKREAILRRVRWPFGMSNLKMRIPEKDRKFDCICWQKVDWIGGAK